MAIADLGAPLHEQERRVEEVFSRERPRWFIDTVEL